MENDDTNLIHSILSGNHDDFRKLVDKYQYMVEKWAFRHVKSLSDAESIAQEAFVEAYFRLDTLREPNKFGSWLHSIVTNISISWLRRQKATVSYEHISGIQSGEKLLEQYNRYEVVKPDDMLEQQEQDNTLQTAINALPPMYQRVIRMFYFDDCLHKDIATDLGISIANVKNILHRARQKLKKEMTKK